MQSVSEIYQTFLNQRNQQITSYVETWTKGVTILRLNQGSFGEGVIYNIPFTLGHNCLKGTHSYCWVVILQSRAETKVV